MISVEVGTCNSREIHKQALIVKKIKHEVFTHKQKEFISGIKQAVDDIQQYCIEVEARRRGRIWIILKAETLSYNLGLLLPSSLYSLQTVLASASTQVYHKKIDLFVFRDNQFHQLRMYVISSL